MSSAVSLSRKGFRLAARHLADDGEEKGHLCEIEALGEIVDLVDLLGHIEDDPGGQPRLFDPHRRSSNGATSVMPRSARPCGRDRTEWFSRQRQ